MSRIFLVLVVPLLLAPVAARADYLGGITFSHPTTSYLPHSEYVHVSVDYKVDEAGGGRVFVRPFTNGALTPGYSASGGPLVGPGTGTVTGDFRITAGEHVVDQVRIRLVSPDQSEVWLEVFVPVHFAYGPHGVFNIDPGRLAHSALRHGQQFHVDFDYETGDPEGCLIFARPYTDGAPTPGYHASGSAVLPPSGSSSQYFSFDDDADVTHVHFRVVNLDQSATLLEFDVPYVLHWRRVGLYDVTFDRDYETSLHNTQDLTASLTVDHDVPEGVRVWARCRTDGASTPGGVYQGSALLPAGTTDVSRFCRVNAGEQDVDAIEILCQGGGPDVSIEVPVRLHWAPHAVQNQVYTPAPPAMLSHEERVNMTFDYLTSAAGSVRIFVWPALDYSLVGGLVSAGSPAYPPPSGSGSFWVSYYTGERFADSMRFKMTDEDQSETLLTFFHHGQWAWGGSGTITPVPPAGPAAVAQLGPVYPNPFNPVATIPVVLGDGATVRLAVFDLRGRLVRSLVDGPLGAGRHELRFDGTGLASGTYLCRLDGPGGVQTRRLTLVR